MEQLTQSDDIELRRKRGPLSKIHNIVTWIRASPQRREPVQGLDGIWNGLSMELHMEFTGVGISSDSMDS
jgi:hypothetical protein